MSVTDKNTANEIINNNGNYRNNLKVVVVIEFINRWGRYSYGLEYRETVGKYKASSDVVNPTIYWEDKNYFNNKQTEDCVDKIISEDFLSDLQSANQDIVEMYFESIENKTNTEENINKLCDFSKSVYNEMRDFRG